MSRFSGRRSSVGFYRTEQTTERTKVKRSPVGTCQLPGVNSDIAEDTFTEEEELRTMNEWERGTHPAQRRNTLGQDRLPPPRTTAVMPGRRVSRAGLGDVSDRGKLPPVGRKCRRFSLFNDGRPPADRPMVRAIKEIIRRKSCEKVRYSPTLYQYEVYNIF